MSENQHYGASIGTAIAGAAAGFGVGAACGYMFRSSGGEIDKGIPSSIVETKGVSEAVALRRAAELDLLSSAYELLALATKESGSLSAQVYVVDQPTGLIFRGYGVTDKGYPLLSSREEDTEPFSVECDGSSLVGHSATMGTTVVAESSDRRSDADMPSSRSQAKAAGSADAGESMERITKPPGGYVACVPLTGYHENVSSIQVASASYGGPASPSMSGLGSRAGIIAILRVTFAMMPSTEQLRALEAVAAEAGPLLSKQRDVKEAEQAQARLALVLQMMRKVAAAASHTAVVETIVQAAYQLLAPQRVTVFQVDHARRKLIISRSEDVNGAEISMDRGIAGSVATTGQVARVPDAYQDSRFNNKVDLQSGFRTRSVLCVPVRNNRGVVVAVIQVINRREFGGQLGRELVPGLSRAKLQSDYEDEDEDGLLTFTPVRKVSHTVNSMIEEEEEDEDAGADDEEEDDGDSAHSATRPDTARSARGTSARGFEPPAARRQNSGDAEGEKDSVVPHGGWAFTAADEVVIQALASQAGMELDKAAAMEEMQRAQDATTAMHEIVQATVLEPSVRGFIHRVMVATYRLLRCERVTLFLVDAAREELVLAYSNDAKGIRIPMRSGLAGHAAMTGKVVNVEDAYRDQRFDRSVDRATGFRTRSVLCIPVQLPATVATASGSDTHEDIQVGGFSSREGLPIAVLQAINKDDRRPFDKLDEDAMRVFSLQVALALKRRTVEAAMLTMLAVKQDEPSSRLTGEEKDDGEDCGAASGAGGSSKGKKQKRVTLKIDVAKAQASPGSSMGGAPTPVGLKTPAGGTASPGMLISQMDQHERKTALSLLSMYSDERRKQELHSQAIFSGVMGAVKAARLMRTPSWTKSVDLQAKGMDTTDELLQWDWDVFEAYQRPDGENVLKQSVARMFSRFNVMSMFKVDETRLRRFVDSIRDTYRNNPFHNWHHAIAVLQANFVILCRTPARNSLMHSDVFGLLVAALCHDADHPGHTNDFECNTGGELAITYSDIAPLEHHHSAVTARILRRPESNIMSSLEPEVFRSTRKLMCRAILSTDMSQHFTQVQQLGKRAADMAQKYAAVSLSAEGSPRADASPSAGVAASSDDGPPKLTKRSSTSEVSSLAAPSPARATSDGSGTRSPRYEQEHTVTRGPKKPDAVSYTIRSRSASMANVLAAVPGAIKQSKSSRHSVHIPKLDAFDRTSEDDRLELAGIVVHLGDLSGQLYPKHLAVRWGNMVSQEFRAQVEKEQELGLASSPVMQGLESEAGVYKSQCGFIQFVLMPLWQNAQELLPGLKDPVQQLKANLMFYQAEVKRLEEAGAASRPAQFIPATAPYDVASPAAQLRERSNGSASSGKSSASGARRDGDDD